jgi:hypothetical protein
MSPSLFSQRNTPDRGGRREWTMTVPPNLLLGKKKTTDKKFQKAVSQADIEQVSVDAYVSMVRQLPTFGRYVDTQFN